MTPNSTLTLPPLGSSAWFTAERREREDNHKRPCQKI